MLEDMPLRQLVMISNRTITPSVMERLFDIIYYHYIRGSKKMIKIKFN